MERIGVEDDYYWVLGGVRMEEYGKEPLRFISRDGTMSRARQGWYFPNWWTISSG
jgi:hypothetical protein